MYRKTRTTIALAAAVLLGLVLLSKITVPGYTRIVLTNERCKETIFFSAVMPDNEQAIITWRNSQFGLTVAEVFEIDFNKSQADNKWYVVLLIIFFISALKQNHVQYPSKIHFINHWVFSHGFSTCPRQ